MLIKINKTTKISPDGISVVKFSASEKAIEIADALAKKLIELGAADVVTVVKPEPPKMVSQTPENKMSDPSYFNKAKKKDGK